MKVKLFRLGLFVFVLSMAGVLEAAEVEGVPAYYIHETSPPVIFSPNSEMLMLANGNLLNVSRKQVMEDLRIGVKVGTVSVFHPNSKFLATISSHGFALHDVRLRRNVFEADVNFGKLIGAKKLAPWMAFSNDGKWLAALGHLDEPNDPQALFLFDLIKRKLVRTILIGSGRAGGCFFLGETGQVVAASQELWGIDVQTGNVLWKQPLEKETSQVWADVSGETILLQEKNRLRGFSRETPQQVRTYLSDDTLLDAAAPLQGTTLFAVNKSGDLIRCDSADASGIPLRVKAHDQAAESVTIAPNGNFVVTTGEDKRLRVWDAATLEPIAYLRVGKASISSPRFSPNGKYLAARVGFGTYVWRWESIASLK